MTSLDKATTIRRLKALEASSGVSSEITWGDVTGKPSSFNPETHTHSMSDVSDLDGEISDIRGLISDLENSDVSWADVTGKPSSFNPATHTHTMSDVLDLEDEISNLQSLIADLEARVAALETASAEPVE